MRKLINSIVQSEEIPLKKLALGAPTTLFLVSIVEACSDFLQTEKILNMLLCVIVILALTYIQGLIVYNILMIPAKIKQHNAIKK